MLQFLWEILDRIKRASKKKVQTHLMSVGLCSWCKFRRAIPSNSMNQWLQVPLLYNRK